MNDHDDSSSTTAPHDAPPKDQHIHRFERTAARSVTPKGEHYIDECTICGDRRRGDVLALTPQTQEAIDLLPDSAFAVVATGGTKDEEGNTVPRTLRLLLHHDSDEVVDDDLLPVAITDEPVTEMSPADHAKAKTHLAEHAKKN